MVEETVLRRRPGAPIIRTMATDRDLYAVEAFEETVRLGQIIYDRIVYGQPFYSHEDAYAATAMRIIHEAQKALAAKMRSIR